jgi:branched-chain amino acid transport system ATP-binding protein
VYGLFPILKERAGQRAGTLSGGQQQQLAIGRIIVDFNRRTGITIVFVEQNLDMIRAIAQRCYVMDKGRIVAKLKPHELDDRDTIRKHLAV